MSPEQSSEAHRDLPQLWVGRGRRRLEGSLAIPQLGAQTHLRGDAFVPALDPTLSAARGRANFLRGLAVGASVTCVSAGQNRNTGPVQTQVRQVHGR